MAQDKDKKGGAASVRTAQAENEPPTNGEKEGRSIDEILAEGKCIPVEICGTRTGGSVIVAGTGTGGAVPVSLPVGPGGAPQPVPVSVASSVPVQLQRSAAIPSDDQAFWVAIRDRTSAISFEAYEEFIETCLCQAPPVPPAASTGLCATPSGNDLLHFGVDGYRRLKTATEAFLIMRCGLVPDLTAFDPVAEESRLGRSVSAVRIVDMLKSYLSGGDLPYILSLLSPGDLASHSASPYCDTVLTGDPMSPCLLELIWNYWHEEGMLVQAINAIALRFQNKRTASGREILGELELSPLRPLSNLIWGYIQDEPFRLTVARRTYEYLHHYGLPLQGRAVPNLQPAESRSRFLEAFHSLLYQVAQFYERDSDTTVIADGFPVLNALKEVHLLLAEGAHNQFRDLPWTARVEMLIQQWLLSRREMREFLRGRQMVPYKERWMGQVDTVKRLYGMSETPVTHFRDLGVFGEQILLSIRYADWNNVVDQDRAKNWARYWKPEVQSYVHAYRAATGVDLTASAQRTQPVNATPPALLLQQRLAQQHRAR
jgi:hypothetical protein